MSLAGTFGCTRCCETIGWLLEGSEVAGIVSQVA